MTFTQDWFRFERMMVAARCVGAAQRLVDEMTGFAQTREIGGKPLGEHQLVAGMLADSATELFAARTMLYEVARSIDAGHDRKTLHGQASMAKLYCSEMAGRVADRAVQVFGGRGYMRENVAERMFRELRVERIWEGRQRDSADHRGSPDDDPRTGGGAGGSVTSGRPRRRTERHATHPSSFSNSEMSTPITR